MSCPICTSVCGTSYIPTLALVSGQFKTNQLISDRDPEAEAEEKVEEEKVPGAEEVGPAAVEAGFVTSGSGDWEAAPAGFSGAQPGWDGQGADEWGAAAAAPPTAEWGATDAKDSQW